MCKYRLINTDKKLLCQSAVTVDTGVTRVWGVLLMEDHSCVKLLEWSLFFVHFDDSEVNLQH